MLSRLVALIPFLLLVSAAHLTPPSQRHQNLIRKAADVAARDEGHRAAHAVIKRQIIKKGQTCRVRPSNSSSSSASSVSSETWTSTSAATTATSSVWTAETTTQTSESTIGQAQYAHDQGKGTTTTSTSSKAPASTGTSGSGSGSGSNSHSGTLSKTDATCGWCDSSPENPNGSEEWINCGIHTGGWTPPFVRVDELIVANLDASGPYGPCASYIETFKAAAAAHGLPAILLAAIAMHESTCNQWATGGNGEAGLMQIAPPNCNNNAGSCWEPNYNIWRGAELLAKFIDNHGGNFFAAMGAYNGWVVGHTTVATATAAASQGNCLAQNNLDYIYQIANGWLQNKSGYSIGTYFNLAHC